MNCPKCKSQAYSVIDKEEIPIDGMMQDRIYMVCMDCRVLFWFSSWNNRTEHIGAHVKYVDMRNEE